MPYDPEYADELAIGWALLETAMSVRFTAGPDNSREPDTATRAGEYQNFACKSFASVHPGGSLPTLARLAC